MPEDVSLAQSPGRLTGRGGSAPEGSAPGDSGPEGSAPVAQLSAWRRYAWLWEVYFALVGAVTVVAVQMAGTAGSAAATALVATLAGWYLLLGRRLVRQPELRRWWWRAGYQVGALALVVPAVWLAPRSSLVVFALMPQTIMLWPLLPAVGWVVGLLVTTWLAAEAGTGRTPSPADALELVPVLALVTMLSFYINRIAQQSGERAALVAELTASREEVSRLAHEAGIAAERQRLAADIHDTIAQGLASVVMLVQSADAAVERDPAAARRHLALAEHTARENLDEARALVAALTPAQLEGVTLLEALRRMASRSRTPATVSLSGLPRPLPVPVKVVLLRAAQESLTNADKHAAAGRVEIRLSYEEGLMTLEVIDDGRGFAAGGHPGDGYGLGSMRARVAQVAGELIVDSTPGAGTTVRVTVPS